MSLKRNGALWAVVAVAFALLSACGVHDPFDHRQCAESSNSGEVGSTDHSVNNINGILLECHSLGVGDKEKVSNSEDNSQSAIVTPMRVNIDGSVVMSMTTDTGREYQLNLHPGAGVQLSNGLTVGLLGVNRESEKEITYGVSWGNRILKSDPEYLPEGRVTKPLPREKTWKCEIASILYGGEYGLSMNLSQTGTLGKKLPRDMVHIWFSNSDDADSAVSADVRAGGVVEISGLGRIRIGEILLTTKKAPKGASGASAGTVEVQFTPE